LTSLIMSGTHDQKVNSTGPPPVEPPQAVLPSKLAPASPAPLIFRKSRRVNSRLIEGPALMLALSPASLRHRTQNALYISSLPQPGRGTVLARILSHQFCRVKYLAQCRWAVFCPLCVSTVSPSPWDSGLPQAGCRRGLRSVRRPYMRSRPGRGRSEHGGRAWRRDGRDPAHPPAPP
jgi:hypothetical protein